MDLQEFLLLNLEVFVATIRRSSPANTLAIYNKDALVAVLSA